MRLVEVRLLSILNLSQTMHYEHRENINQMLYMNGLQHRLYHKMPIIRENWVNTNF